MRKRTDTRERRLRERILRTSEAMTCVELARHVLLQDRKDMGGVREAFDILEGALTDRMSRCLGLKGWEK